MPGFKSKEQMQQVALAGLIVVAVVVAYVRFGRSSEPGRVETPSPPVVTDLVEIPSFDASVIAQWQQPLPKPRPYVAVARDVFNLPRRTGLLTEDGQPLEGTRLRLGAVMAGRDGAVARINNAYARVGDQVGPYKVVDIAFDTVVLESNEESLTLTLVR